MRSLGLWLFYRLLVVRSPFIAPTLVDFFSSCLGEDRILPIEEVLCFLKLLFIAAPTLGLESFMIKGLGDSS